MTIWRKMNLRRGPLAVLAIAVSFTYGAAAWAQQQPVKLFKVISPKDEVEIGLSDDELKGSASDLENLAKRLADSGQITVWQYAVRKNSNGDLEHAPLKKVAIFKNDTLRIEPFNPAPLKVVPADK
jgi:hypothetical protein